MRNRALKRRAALAIMLTLVSSTGCADGEPAEPASAAAVRSVIAAVQAAGTLQADVRLNIEGSLASGVLRGEAQVIAGDDMQVDYDYRIDGMSGSEYQGTLLRLREATYYRSSAQPLPEGKSWAKAPEPDFDLVRGALAFADPLFVLAAGFESVVKGDGAPESVNGVETTRYQSQWHFSLHEPTGPLATFVNRHQTAYLDVDLWVDASGQLVQLEFNSIALTDPGAQFWVTATYRDFGLPVTLAEPEPATLA